MHNELLLNMYVPHLKCSPLHPNQKWSKYAFKRLCFCTDIQVLYDETFG